VDALGDGVGALQRLTGVGADLHVHVNLGAELSCVSRSIPNTPDWERITSRILPSVSSSQAVSMTS
jgi:hypothetical protein